MNEPEQNRNQRNHEIVKSQMFLNSSQACLRAGTTVIPKSQKRKLTPRVESGSLIQHPWQQVPQGGQSALWFVCTSHAVDRGHRRAGVVYAHRTTFPINAISRPLLSRPPPRGDIALGLVQLHGLFSFLFTKPKIKEYVSHIIQCSIGFFSAT